MRGVGHTHLLEQNERIAIALQLLVVHGDDFAALGEDAPVRVANPPLHLGQVMSAEFRNPRITQGHQARLNVLGNGAVRHCMMDEPPGEIELSNRRPRPVDDGRRQDASNRKLLAEPGQERVDSRRVDVGQLGEIAGSHDHRGLWVTAADEKISFQRGGKADADGFKNRINPIFHALANEKLDCCVEPVERAGLVRNGHYLHAPIDGLRPVGRVYAQDKLGPRRGRGAGFDGVKRVNRHAHSLVSKHLHRVAQACPRDPGITSQVDHVGRLVLEPFRLPEQFIYREPGRMIDLGEDLDVVRAVSGRRPVSLTEMTGKVAEIFRTRLDRHTWRPLKNRSKVSMAVARQNHFLDAIGNLKMASHPFGRHQGSDRNRQDCDVGPKASSGGKLLQHTSQCEFRQAARDEQIAWRIVRRLRFGRVRFSLVRVHGSCLFRPAHSQSYFKPLTRSKQLFELPDDIR